MENKGFIKNLDLLEETYKVDDFLDFSATQKMLKGKLDNAHKNSVLGLIADFGSGKSVMLENMARQAVEDELWINFDAWKFPERKDLWEGFVLDSVRSIDSNFFEEIRKKIDGEKFNGVKNLINVVFEGANCFIPGFSLGKNFSKLFKSSPVRRVFEFQEMFKEFIDKKVDIKYKKIYFIIEDIDRSGDKGIFFLETLKYFLSNNNFDKKVHAIIPIATKNYEKSEDNDSYKKVLDYSCFLELKNIDFTKFIEELFDQSFFDNSDNWVGHINILFKRVTSEYGLTMRSIKYILRNSNLSFINIKDNEKDKAIGLDIRIFLVFSFLRILKKENKLGSFNNYVHLINNEKRFSEVYWAVDVFMSVINDLSQENFNNRGQFIFKEYKGALPKYFGNNTYILSDKYLDLETF